MAGVVSSAHELKCFNEMGTRVIHRIINCLLIFITAFILVFVALLNDAHAYGPYQADFIGAIDGDSVILGIEIWPGLVQIQNVRLAGIDTPELRGKCEIEKILAVEAKDYVANKLGSSEDITITVYRLGKFGRPIAQILADGVDLSLELLELGLGRKYEGGKRETWC